MKRIISIFLSLMFVFAITSCGEEDSEIRSKNSEIAEQISDKDNSSKIAAESENISKNIPEIDSQNKEISNENESPENSDKMEGNELNISVNGHTLKANLADTQAAKELYELIKNKPLTLTLSDYGSFEKVGRLPQNFTQNDKQITAQPGDIMLYQGNQMTIFYGENSWSYTRLGKIENTSAKELAEIFGNGDITVTILNKNPDN